MEDGQDKSTLTNDEFVEAIKEYEDELRGVVGSFTNNQPDTDELVQKTLTKAWERLDQYEKGTNFRAWILKIGRNAAINQWRAEKLHDAREREERDYIRSSTRSEPPNKPSRIVESKQWHPAVVEALESLDLPYRRTLVLRELHDFSYKEIAYILECPTGTVMSRLYRARRKFKKALKGEDLSSMMYSDDRMPDRRPNTHDELDREEQRVERSA